MTTTVTTVTVTTTTVLGLTGALGLITTLTLVALLIGKEITAATPGQRTIRWGRTLNVGIVPLLVAFAIIVAVKLAQVL